MKERNVSIPTMYIIKHASEMTGLSYDYIRKLCLTNRIVFVRAGSKYLVNMEKLIDYLNTGERSGVSSLTLQEDL